MGALRGGVRCEKFLCSLECLRFWSVLTIIHFFLSVNNTGKESCKRVNR